jgi:ATP-dependent Clp protease ATP-binding subunit ClpA
MFTNASSAVARFNMNEYKERHEIARLIGAPPGFIGHDQPGAIFRFAEANPEGLIILDEMEKAHHEIQDYFLQIFDKGEAQDSRGRKVDFRPYVFVMTCNVGIREATRHRIGFAAVDATHPGTNDRGSRGQLAQHFRLEFLARIRRVIQFREIDRKAYLTLLERRLVALAGKMKREHSIALQVTETAKSQFADSCTDQPDGCRGFERLFDRLIASPVANHMNDHPQTATITFTEFSDGKPVVHSEDGP